MNPLRIVIVGSNRTVETRHLPAIKRARGMNVVGIMDSDITYVENIARKAGIKRYSDMKPLADIGWVQNAHVIVIASDFEMRSSLIAEALAIKKCVWTEAPYSISPEEIIAFNERAYTSDGRPLGTFLNARFLDSVVHLSSAIRSGELGQITGVEVFQSASKSNSIFGGENRTSELSIQHSTQIFSVITMLFGPLSNSNPSESCIENKTEIKHVANYNFHSGSRKAKISVDLNYFGKANTSAILVRGEKATAMIDIVSDVFQILPMVNASPSDFLEISTWRFKALLSVLKGRLGQKLNGYDKIYDIICRTFFGNMDNFEFVNSDSIHEILSAQLSAMPYS